MGAKIHFLKSGGAMAPMAPLVPTPMPQATQGLHHIFTSHMYVVILIMYNMMSIAWCVTMVIITSSYTVLLPWLPSIIGGAVR